ncbi:hypothetical protein V490_04787, partial [Pseudogymnoascus sp. VKM F-3557]
QLSAISSGDLLRTHVQNRTPLGIRAESAIKAGSLVPDAMILRLILHELKDRGWLFPGEKPYDLNSSSAAGGEDAHFVAGDMMDTPSLLANFPSPRTCDQPESSFILDGFPRTAEQAVQLDNLVPINLVVHLDTPFSVIMDRIAGRWVHAPSGRSYNTSFNAPRVPGRDDVTGEVLTKRADDDESVWLERLEKFKETSEPLLEHYARKGVLWRVEGQTSDEITPKLHTEFAKRFALRESERRGDSKLREYHCSVGPSILIENQSREEATTRVDSIDNQTRAILQECTASPSYSHHRQNLTIASCPAAAGFSRHGSLGCHPLFSTGQRVYGLALQCGLHSVPAISPVVSPRNHLDKAFKVVYATSVLKLDLVSQFIAGDHGLGG